MTDIGIVGAGISGLQLALRLQQLGVGATVYSPHDVEQLGSGRPRNFPARFGRTQHREERLDVFAWPQPDAQVWSWNVTVGGDDAALRFHADLTPPSSVVDFRLYLPHLLSTFVARGGALVVGEPTLDRVAPRHDLVVVANGSGSMRDLFPVDRERSPFTSPQRILCSGLYHGIHESDPHSLEVRFLPGVGEIFRIPFLTRLGRADVLAFEAVPGGPLEGVSRLDADADPSAFYAETLRLLGEYTPDLRERVEPNDFALIAPGELAQGGITPVVRRGWARVADDTCALAIGDAWITNDPLSAQGANLGSHSAFVLADLVAAATGPFDEAFCRASSARLWEHARSVVSWSNAFLGPPPPHVLSLFSRAAGDKRIADAFVNMFNDPVAMWETVSDAEGVAAFCANHEKEA